MHLRGKKIWVTGAASGIGKALAEKLSDIASLLIMSDVDREKLDSLKLFIQSKAKSCEIVTVAFDLSNSKSVLQAADHVKSKYKGVDILINNGGISQRGTVVNTSFEVDRRIMEINFFGHILLTKQMLPYMLAQKSGHIAVTSSITGKFGFPLRSSYAASKHALHGYFETLGLELINSGIRVTIVCPGRVRTNISFNAIDGAGVKHGKLDAGQAKGITAEKCAIKYIKAIEKKRWEVYIGGSELLIVRIKRFIPSLFRYLASRISSF